MHYTFALSKYNFAFLARTTSRIFILGEKNKRKKKKKTQFSRLQKKKKRQTCRKRNWRQKSCCSSCSFSVDEITSFALQIQITLKKVNCDSFHSLWGFAVDVNCELLSTPPQAITNCNNVCSVLDQTLSVFSSF